MTISTADKKHYRTIAHNLNPVVIVGDKGLTENLLEELNRAIHDHELIKVKLSVGDRDAKKAIIEQICQQFDALLVQSIGHIILLYRTAKKPNPKLSNLLRP